jgi:hypothetical protein
MEEVKRNEQRVTVEDLMYASVLEKFVEVGVDMLPRLENVIEAPADLKVRNFHASFLCAFSCIQKVFAILLRLHAGVWCRL